MYEIALNMENTMRDGAGRIFARWSKPTSWDFREPAAQRPPSSPFHNDRDIPLPDVDRPSLGETILDAASPQSNYSEMLGTRTEHSFNSVIMKIKESSLVAPLVETAREAHTSVKLLERTKLTQWGSQSII